MREPPKIADAEIGAVLRERYNVAATKLSFLPLGNDSASFVYRIDAIDGAAFLLKVRAGSGFESASLAVPRFLCDSGVPKIVAPLPAATRELWTDVKGYALSLWPFIEGRRGGEGGLSHEQWRTLGATAEQIHESRLPPDLERVVPCEPFVPSRRSLIEELDHLVGGASLSDRWQREWAAFWRSRSDVIHTVVRRADALGKRLRRTSNALVLCHADLHPWNVLVDAEWQLWLIDWDETILALKERDLMFVVGGIGGDSVTEESAACFMEGYGSDRIDSTALAYYRYAWAVQDIAACGERVFFLPDLGEEARRDAVRGFMSLFDPGNIVARALASGVQD